MTRNEHVHPVFRGILQSMAPHVEPDDEPTDDDVEVCATDRADAVQFDTIAERNDFYRD